MPIPFSSDLYVTKNYRWDEDRCEFWHIGNKLRRSDRLYEARVDVYEDRVKTWFLEPAASLPGRNDYAGRLCRPSHGSSLHRGSGAVPQRAPNAGQGDQGVV